MVFNQNKLKKGRSMKRLVLLMVIVVFSITLNAKQRHEWWFLGVANTTLSKNYTKDFEKAAESTDEDLKFGNLIGLQIGYAVMLQFENNLSFGMDVRYVEKGWTTETKDNLNTMKNSYLDLVLKSGYFMPEVNYIPIIRQTNWQPYIGVGMSAFMNSETPIKTNVETYYSFVVGLDILSKNKFTMNTNYSLGFTEIMEGESKAKLNTLSVGLGRKF